MIRKPENEWTKSADLKEAYVAWLSENYPSIWRESALECAGDEGDGVVWMLSAANYLFRTGSIRWAVDPSYSAHYVQTPNGAADDLSFLDCALLTHVHADHCDRTLISQLCRRRNLLLAVPRHMAESALSEADSVNCDLRIVDAGDVIRVGGLRATAFDSAHYDPPVDGGERIGCEETGWLVEVDGKRLLFPGDVRDYSTFDSFPEFGRLDWLFAHLWFGRRKAFSFDERDVEAFTGFMGSFGAENVCFAHLLETSRVPEDYWTLEHAELAERMFEKRFPKTKTTTLTTGERIDLW